MYDLLSRLQSYDLVGVVSLVLVFGTILGAVVAVLWYRLRKAEGLNRLKQDMLDRGMSPEEIQTVLAAGTKDCLR